MKDGLIGTAVFLVLMSAGYFMVTYFDKSDSVEGKAVDNGLRYSIIEGPDAEIDPDTKKVIEDSFAEHGVVEATNEQVDAAFSLLEKIADKLENQPKTKVESKPARTESLSGGKKVLYYDLDASAYIDVQTLEQKSELFYFDKQTRLAYSLRAPMSRVRHYEWYTDFGGDDLVKLSIDWEKNDLVVLERLPVQVNFQKLDNVSNFSSSGSYWSDGTSLLYINRRDNPLIYSAMLVEGVDVSRVSKLYASWHAHYVTDGKSVVFNGEQIVDVDPTSFLVIENESNSWKFGHYSMDKNNVYYLGKKIREASPDGFRLLEVIAKPRYQFSIAFDSNTEGFFIDSCFLGKGGRPNKYDYATEIVDNSYSIEFDNGLTKSSFKKGECD